MNALVNTIGLDKVFSFCFYRWNSNFENEIDWIRSQKWRWKFERYNRVWVWRWQPIWFVCKTKELKHCRRAFCAQQWHFFSLISLFSSLVLCHFSLVQTMFVITYFSVDVVGFFFFSPVWTEHRVCSTPTIHSVSFCVFFLVLRYSFTRIRQQNDWNECNEDDQQPATIQPP